MSPAARTSPSFTPSSIAHVPTLLAELVEAGYTEGSLRQRLGLSPAGNDYPGELGRPMLTAAFEAEPVVDVLVRALLLGMPVSLRTLERALSPPSIDVLVSCGVAHTDGGSFRADVQLFPAYGLWLACDLDVWNGGRSDTVWRPDVSAASVLSLIAPAAGEPRGRVLDVGTGSGVIALAALRQHGFASATVLDVNPRAVAFARWNAALNGLTVEAHVAPVGAHGLAGGFDLVTFSMPMLYAVRSDDNVALHAADGDQLLRQTYAALPALLSERGRAVLFHQVRVDPPAYFPSLVNDVGASLLLDVTWLETSHRELDPFGCAQVRRRGGGALARERGRDRAVRIVRQPGSLARTLDRARFDGAALTDEIVDGGADRVAAAVPVLAPGTTAYRAYDAGPRGWVERRELHVGGELLDDASFELLGRCDGHATAGEIARRSGAAGWALERLASLARAGLLSLVERT